MKICRKVFQQKRKQFNSAANRLSEFDNASELIANAYRLEREKPKGSAKGSQGVPKWKQKSLAFRQAILAAKAAGGDSEARVKADIIQQKLDAVGGGADPDMTRCPHCGRTFNREAGERHIAVCVKTFGNKPGGGRLVKGGGRVAAAAPAASGGWAPPAGFTADASLAGGGYPSAMTRKPSANRGRAGHMQGPPQPAAAYRPALAPRY